MTIGDKIRDEKLQYNINGKVDKYEYLTGKKILPSNQIQTVMQLL